MAAKLILVAFTRPNRRIIALLVLVALPAVVVARLSLDARTTFGDQPKVETEHDASCSTAHDHELCVLLAHGTLSLNPPAVVVAIPPQSQSVPLFAIPALRICDSADLQLARAPPLFA